MFLTRDVYATGISFLLDELVILCKVLEVTQK